MRGLGLTILPAPTAGTVVVKGDWPGIHQAGGGAGPTGNPWIDSNGWKVRLARLRQAGSAVWVEAAPKDRRIIPASAYPIAWADAAMYGAPWIIDLDADLRRALAARESRALDAWQRLMSAARVIRPRPEDQALGVVGILSDFTGEGEFASGELLNLTARLNQPYRILRKSKGPPLDGLEAIVYADAVAPAAELRRKLVEFVQSGGLLVAGEKAGIGEGKPSAETHRNYTIRALGRGRIAIGDLSDPYQSAADAQILLSHRHDLVRFWNGSSLVSYLTQPADGKGARLQIVNYAGRPGADPVSVRIAGPYREARIRRLEDAAVQPLESTVQKGAIELHLPPFSVYAAIELA